MSGVRKRRRPGSEQSDEDLDRDPEGGHDPKSLDEAAERMHARKRDEPRDPDPAGGHDPQALEDAARRMKAEP
jgi:hypothetical protein